MWCASLGASSKAAGVATRSTLLATFCGARTMAILEYRRRADRTRRHWLRLGIRRLAGKHSEPVTRAGESLLGPRPHVILVGEQDHLR